MTEPLAGRASWGPFRVLGTLGRGGTAWVYAVERAGRRYALKLPDLEQALSVRGEQRLDREARIAAGLDHPHAVRLVETGNVEQRPYLLYELVPGARTLTQAFAEAPLAVRVAWVRDVARAVGAAHARGVVHRDLKPENVLVDDAGRARVTDFGAGWIAEAETLTRTGDLVGTPLYLAPEQLDGARATHPAADVWALGLLLYQALCGAHPFAGAGLATLVEAAQSGVAPPSSRASGVPPALDAVCARCLALDPGARYPDGEHLAAALDGWLAQAPPEPTTPRRLPELPGYELLGPLGAGAMGVVYRARDTALGREVAVKLLQPAAGPAAARRLQRFAVEARAAARIRHPGLVAVHATGATADGRPYVVSELIDGEPLEARLGRVDAAAAARLVLPLAEALAALHAAGIVHRDVKPENILVDRTGRARLTDFGIARLLDAEERLTATGQTLGTPLYMAPEQLGAARRADGRADVYALGATLYHLAAGVPPAEATNYIALAQAKAQLPPPPSGVDPRLGEVCLRCLAPDPDDRYPDAEALAADLRRYLDGDALTHHPAGRRRRARLAAAGAALAVALGAGGLAATRRPAAVPAAPTLAPGARLEQALAALARDGDPEPLDAALAALPDPHPARVALEAVQTALGDDPRASLRRFDQARAQGVAHPLLAALAAVGRGRAGVQADPAADLEALDGLGPALATHPAACEARARTLQRLGRLDEALAALGPAPPADLASALLAARADRLLTTGDAAPAAALLEDPRFDPAQVPAEAATLAGLAARGAEASIRASVEATTTADPSWALDLAAELRVLRALDPAFRLQAEQVLQVCTQWVRWGTQTAAVRVLHPVLLDCVPDAPPDLLAQAVLLDSPSDGDQARRLLAPLERALTLTTTRADDLRVRRVELWSRIDSGKALALATEALPTIHDPNLRLALRVERARAALFCGRPAEALADLADQTSVEARQVQQLALLALDRPAEAAASAEATIRSGLIANAAAHGAAHIAWRAFTDGAEEPARRALAAYAALSGAQAEYLAQAAAVHLACGAPAEARALLARYAALEPGKLPAGLAEALERGAPDAEARLRAYAQSLVEASLRETSASATD